MTELGATPCGPLSSRARRAGAAYAGPGSGAINRDLDGPPPISFTVGLPDPALLPASELTSAAAEVLARDGDAALQYGGSQGYEPLREWLAAHWSEIEGMDLTPGHFGMANGSAGALANLCETFLDPGDVVGVEAPSFPGSIRAIRSITPRLESIPVDDHGLDVDVLSERLDELARAGESMRMLYTIPTFHNPTGTTLTLARRERLVDVCRRHDVLIVEDHAYGELWFDDAPPRSLYALAAGEGVIRIGTFSKIVAPGLRSGWAMASPSVIEALVATRCDMGTSSLVLRMLERLTASGFVDDHIARGRAVYASKRAIALAGLASSCSGLADWKSPAGGFFIWMKVADRVDPLALPEAARLEGVSYVSGRIFFAEQTAAERVKWGPAGDSRYLRLAFSAVTEKDIVEGTARLGRALASAAESFVSSTA